MQFLKPTSAESSGDASLFRRFAGRLLSGRVLAVLVLLMLVGPGEAQAQPANGLLREVYREIGGGSVADLLSAPSYPNSPTETGYVTDFEAPSDVYENYGQRLRGYLTPPVTGNYTFWIATDDGGALYLSTDDTVANRREIATVTGWTPSRDWGREPNQQSAPIRQSRSCSATQPGWSFS